LFLVATIEANKALSLMQDLEFSEAIMFAERAASFFQRMGFQDKEKHSRFNIAICLYAKNQLNDARLEFAKIHDHATEKASQVWETRITVELGDGFVLEVPKIEPQEFGFGYYQLTQALLALSFGDYQKVWDMTAEPIHDSDWHWALARVHAGWRLGLHDPSAIEKVLTGQADDPALSGDLTKSYADFIRLVLSEWTFEIKRHLQLLCQDYVASPIGVLARDVSLSLSET
jgi:hypothetical protein